MSKPYIRNYIQDISSIQRYWLDNKIKLSASSMIGSSRYSQAKASSKKISSSQV